MVTRKMPHSRRHSLTLKPQLHNDQTFHVLTENYQNVLQTTHKKPPKGTVSAQSQGSSSYGSPLSSLAAL